ncbi:polysaccharide pyruvyl transferase family protein [Ruegeria atlantica]|uniref:polysaccharide pyruvyl transferase family protein n=1 Tax=Ruegeria atlantica TaxID=81569 RepID=UPI001480E44E|nr:polysaccharide pyruvyl transferase family protein [Ruegeria atlantica]
MKYLFRKPKAVILNDTRRDGDHLGCHFVMGNLIELCTRHGINVSRTIQSKKKPQKATFQKRIRGADIVILNGEGSLHHDRGIGLFEQAALAADAGKPVVLVNSVWQSNPKTKEYLQLFKLTAFRESTSMKLASADGAKEAICVPDLSLYKHIESVQSPKGNLIFTDSVLHDVSAKLKTLSAGMDLPSYAMANGTPNPLTLDRITNADAIVGGRFHALCLGLSAGKPMLCIESNTHKIGALLSDLGIDLSSYLLVNSEDLTEKRVNEFAKQDHTDFIAKSRNYVLQGRKDMDRMFNKIRHLV